MNRVMHFEINSQDPQKAIDFYSQVFGWEIKKWDNPAMDYWLVMTGGEKEPGGINGGIMKRQGPNPTTNEAINSFVCSIDVQSIDESLEKIKQAGGQIVNQKMA